MGNLHLEMEAPCLRQDPSLDLNFTRPSALAVSPPRFPSFSSLHTVAPPDWNSRLWLMRHFSLPTASLRVLHYPRFPIVDVIVCVGRTSYS